MTTSTVELGGLDRRQAVNDWLDGRDVIQVRAWRDPRVEEHGHPANGGYVETYWLPIMGPTTIMLLRKLGPMARQMVVLERPGGMQVDVHLLSRAVGLGPGDGRHAPVRRALARLVEHNAARLVDDVFEVRTHLADLSAKRVLNLPPEMRERCRAAAKRPDRSTA